VCVCVCVCVWLCMYAVNVGIQSGCWISVEARMRHWKLAASFPPTLATYSLQSGKETLCTTRNQASIKVDWMSTMSSLRPI
jgi:hypothetical protein